MPLVRFGNSKPGNGSAWHIAATPKLHTEGDALYSAAAVSPSDVWAVGDQQLRNGTFATLIEHWDGKRWSVVPSPDPGSSGNQLYGVAAAGPADIWAPVTGPTRQLARWLCSRQRRCRCCPAQSTREAAAAAGR